MTYMKETCCPYCSSVDITFGAFVNFVNGGYYPVCCNSCGKKAQQEYQLIFNTWTNDKGEKIL